MADKNALLIIDMQNDFIRHNAPLQVAQGLSIVPQIAKVLAAFRQTGDLVFHVVREHRKDGSDVEKNRKAAFVSGSPHCVPGTKGCEIVSELTPAPHEHRVVKRHYSGFLHTELDLLLRRHNITRLVVCGVQYPNCIRATIFDAVSLGYDVTLVTDACGAQTQEIADANIFDIANIGVVCVTTKAFLASESLPFCGRVSAP